MNDVNIAIYLFVKFTAGLTASIRASVLLWCFRGHATRTVWHLLVQCCMETITKRKFKNPGKSQNGRAPRASRAAHAHFWGIFQNV